MLLHPSPAHHQNMHTLLRATAQHLTHLQTEEESRPDWPRLKPSSAHSPRSAPSAHACHVGLQPSPQSLTRRPPVVDMAGNEVTEGGGTGEGERERGEEEARKGEERSRSGQ